MSQLAPPALERFELLRTLPLTDEERDRLRGTKRKSSRSARAEPGGSPAVLSSVRNEGLIDSSWWRFSRARIRSSRSGQRRGSRPRGAERERSRLLACQAARNEFLFAAAGEAVPKRFEEPVWLYEVGWRD